MGGGFFVSASVNMFRTTRQTAKKPHIILIMKAIGGVVVFFSVLSLHSDYKLYEAIGSC